ncbi:hypothetical protein Dred_2612 [Desulforamulus reducens MI-1]|uniref:NTP pyrophosphohydrolase MazG-like domain-containing protein n=1 Tax=Desulforamulus reducens (strain ATCC BAA-1160 / DSM 100696 / MI-1) TaxID=349161 RepID=A4J7R9_DESRM|nr:MazG nucleotide pyrophosphohydrolase domain-containing protein [Desulforamulus reducens]ABO51122.1 hypothetical protein Dred_2612 [Desulforamulus reducens MI-1]
MDINIAGMTKTEKQLLNNLLQKYGANEVLECSKKVLEIERMERDYQFSYAFPAVKFVASNSVPKQLFHIVSELIEVANATQENQNRTDEEMADLLHSCETYFRIREREGVDVRHIFLKVIKKNIVRDYYLED